MATKDEMSVTIAELKAKVADADVALKAQQPNAEKMAAEIVELKEAIEASAVLDWNGEAVEQGKLYLMTEVGLAEHEGGDEALDPSVTAASAVVAIVGSKAFILAGRDAIVAAGGDSVMSPDDFGVGFADTSDEADLARWDEFKERIGEAAEGLDWDLTETFAATMLALLDGSQDDALAMLKADKVHLTIERDEARNQVQGLAQQLRDAGTTHGSIDALPSVV